MKLIYVASPYLGDIEKNTEFAKKACRHTMEQGHVFFCPHLMYPNILDDSKPEERNIAINMGLEVLKKCDELWCYGDKISYGMHLEIQEAKKQGIPMCRILENKNGFIIGNIKTNTRDNNSYMSIKMG